MKDGYVCKNTSECLKEQDQKVLADFQQLQDVQKKLAMSYIQGLLKTAFVDKAFVMRMVRRLKDRTVWSESLLQIFTICQTKRKRLRLRMFMAFLYAISEAENEVRRVYS